MHSKDLFKRSDADRHVERYIFGCGIFDHRFCRGRAYNRALERIRRAGGRLCCIWFEHFLLCVCTKISRRGSHERILCDIAVHRNCIVACDISSIPSLHLLYRACNDGNRSVALFSRQTSFQKEKGRALSSPGNRTKVKNEPNRLVFRHSISGTCLTASAVRICRASAVARHASVHRMNGRTLRGRYPVQSR